jgi:gliding motility-associated-like protein
LTAIAPPSDIISIISHTTCGQNNGAISIESVTDGTSPFVYSFNNGPFSNSTFYNNLSAGIYPITVQDANNCEFSVSVSVEASEGITDATISSIDATCDDNNGSIIVENVSGGLSPYTYQINDGLVQSSPVFSNLASGNYTIAILDATNCNFVTNTTINGGTTPTADFTVTPESADIGNGIFTATNQSSSDVVTFEWYTPLGTPQTGNDAVFQTTIHATETGAQPITLIVTNEFGCIDSITKFVFLTNQVLFYAPNSFTPDGDKFNEEWRVYIENFDVNSFELLIFNRWGEVVFESRNAQVGWNGTYNNLICPEGVYIWHVTFSELDTDNKLTYKGHINLIR